MWRFHPRSIVAALDRWEAEVCHLMSELPVFQKVLFKSHVGPKDVLQSAPPYAPVIETVVKMISATRTRQGLKIKAVLDKRRYETGVKISKAQMNELNIQPHKQNPDWNYSLLPHTSPSPLR
jgi:Rhodopirellula transposase DDE domain